MSSFVDLMQTVPAPFNMVVLIVLIMSLAGVCTSLGKQVRKYACHRQELEFKRQMLDRGLATEEIERLVRVHGDSSSAST